jgi:hypothetical protein
MSTESFIDYCSGVDILSATSRVNEQVKMNENAGWMMIQCQLIKEEQIYIYSTVYQRVKEQIIKQVPLPKFNLEDAKEQPKLSGEKNERHDEKI